jgi:hypothetical protein
MAVKSESLSYQNYRGNMITREVNMVIDVRNFLGTPGYSMLVVAANTNLSVADIERYLRLIDEDWPGVERGTSWIRRRRWLFQQPGTVNARGPQANLDGNQARAVRIMGENPNLSVRQLVHWLKENGIKRGRQWVLQHRLDWKE